jgi:hypothetical protein
MKALAWYTLIVEGLGVIVGIAMVGQSMTFNPLHAILVLVAATPIIIFAVLVIRSLRKPSVI